MWDMISAISQSAREFKIDNTFKIKIICVRAAVGWGRCKANYDFVKSKSVIQINNDDGKCLPLALVVALTHSKKLAAGDNCPNELRYVRESIRKSNRPTQLEKANELIRCAGVDFNREQGWGVPEISAFQNYFKIKGVAVMVYNEGCIGNGERPLFDGQLI